jgi:uncharacterized protein YifE (UPF0438 family)
LFPVEPEKPMLHPPDHAALLARHDFVIPPGEFTEAERAILAKYGRWLEALAAGTITPTTPGQEQFIAVSRSEREPETDFEKAWVSLMRQRAVADAVSRTFLALSQARAERAALEAEYSAARTEVLARVRDQLDGVDEVFAGRLAAAAEAAAAAEQAVRDLILRLGKSVSIGGVRATYSAPRVSWDTKKLDAYAEEHPEVKAFRKVGKPTVALRFVDKPADAKQAPPATDETNTHE